MTFRRKRLPRSEIDLTDARWDQRAITLIHDRATTERICADWEAAGWLVMAIDTGPPDPSGLPTHVVRLAVPPSGWRSLAELVAEQDEAGT